MKKHYLLPALTATILLGACTGTDKAETDSTATSDTTTADTAASHSVAAIANIPFEVQKFEKKKGDDELMIEYPVKGNPELLRSVRNWINESLGNKFRGDLDNGEALFHVYSSDLGEDPELEEFGGYAKDMFKLEYINDYFVTYAYTSYIYEGGAHGLGGTYGATFRQSDGMQFGKKCFTSYSKMHKLFIDGLKRYFKVKTDSELASHLNEGVSLNKLAAPGRAPWIDKEGVVFSYIPYEIAPYSEGSPHFTIPYSEIEPYLSEEGKSFFSEK